jgi:hypothetical protein
MLVAPLEQHEVNFTAALRKDYPFYAFKICHGMVASSWFTMLVRNKFSISPARLPRAFTVSLLAIVNSTLGAIQNFAFGDGIANAVLEKPPLFIIGHWRTGTTYLHELISLDQSFIAPKTFECLAPASFILLGGILRYLSFFMPKKRPMDNMIIGWHSPQEDEIALANLGLPSPYESMMFPNNRTTRHKYLTLTDLSGERIEAWKRGFLRFLQSVNFRRNVRTRSTIGTRRIVLKSPPHTARVRVLEQMFPTAQYIHVVRHPYDVFASTLLLWKAMFETQGMQKPRFDALPNGAPSIEEYVLETMNTLYHDLSHHIKKIPPDRFCEVRYEDLVRSPSMELERIYRQLNLGDFSTVRPQIEAHLRKLEDYKPNEYRLSEAQKAVIHCRWNWYIERYGYHAA